MVLLILLLVLLLLLFLMILKRRCAIRRNICKNHTHTWPDGLITEVVHCFGQDLFMCGLLLMVLLLLRRNGVAVISVGSNQKVNKELYCRDFDLPRGHIIHILWGLRGVDYLRVDWHLGLNIAALLE